MYFDVIHGIFGWIWIQSLKVPLSIKCEPDQVIILKIISSFFVFSSQKIMWYIENEKLPWQYLITMAIDKICKMTVKGIELKSKSFFLIFYGVLELWRKPRKGVDSARSAPKIGLRCVVT